MTQQPLATPPPQVVAFGTLSVSFDRRVLAPRTWTTSQSRWARELLDDAPSGAVLELCSGVAHIGLLAVHGTDRRLVCVDADPVACEYAVANAAAAGRAGLVDVRQEPLGSFSADELFPVIIADPPWVRSELVGCFPADPVAAIDGGADGLDLARACVAVIDRCLHAEGRALLQLGSYAQADLLQAELPDSLVLTKTRAEPGRGLVVKLVRPDAAEEVDGRGHHARRGDPSR
ncbi:methyltransferase [Nocardioides carbamazepini]|uniref:methyltransferase n=1 Tax=Nocardioides carbamazepini TaxID=2854259 RepID=UPI002149F9F2|nr:methyltransferase [Nocardioides carbamazepini]MCR1784036.1 methyltransferase [Nocardioides carbamazepini]